MYLNMALVWNVVRMLLYVDVDINCGAFNVSLGLYETETVFVA